MCGFKHPLYAIVSTAICTKTFIILSHYREMVSQSCVYRDNLEFFWILSNFDQIGRGPLCATLRDLTLYIA